MQGGDGRPADTNKPEAFLTAARPGVPPPWLGVAAPKCCSPPPIHNKIYPYAHFWEGWSWLNERADRDQDSGRDRVDVDSRPWWAALAGGAM